MSSPLIKDQLPTSSDFAAATRKELPYIPSPVTLGHLSYTGVQANYHRLAGQGFGETPGRTLVSSIPGGRHKGDTKRDTKCHPYKTQV